jgi:signal transduction histidine kinase
VGGPRVHVETASTAGSIRRLAERRSYDLVLMDRSLIDADPTLVGHLAVQSTIVSMQPPSEDDSPSPGIDAVVPREGSLLCDLARTVSRLVGQGERAEPAPERQNRFVDVVCHDLRNPASTIVGFAELLLERSKPPLTAEQASAIARIRKNAYFMLDLIESILDTERLEAGVLKPAIAAQDLTELVRDAVEDFRPAAEAKAIALAAVLPAHEIPARIDRRLFARAVANLISNALKFSSADSRVEVGLTNAVDDISIWVRDEGPGIPAAEQDRLFTKFGRTSVLSTRGEHQTGLGLYIVKQILALHGARVEVDSVVGRGSEFRIHLDGR